MPKSPNNSSARSSRGTGNDKRSRRNSQARGSARSRRGRDRRLSVRGELRDAPDVRKIARAVIAMAVAQAEADAAASHDRHREEPDA